MEQIAVYLDELFSSLPRNPAMERVKKNLLHNMQQRHTELVMLGRSDQEAGEQVVAEFSAPGETMADTEAEALEKKYRQFHKRYPVYIAAGFGGMLVLPILILFLILSLESKILALTGWVVSVLVFVAFITCVSYRHESLKKKLGLRPPHVPPQPQQGKS